MQGNLQLVKVQNKTSHPSVRRPENDRMQRWSGSFPRPPHVSHLQHLRRLSEMVQEGGGDLSWKIKGGDTEIGGLLCMLLAVMHQSIRRPLYYSDCTHYSDEGLEVYRTLRATAETRLTFSIVAGHFELVVNPSRPAGVIGHFSTPVRFCSDLRADRCKICTLHLFAAVGVPLFCFGQHLFVSAGLPQMQSQVPREVCELMFSDLTELLWRDFSQNKKNTYLYSGMLNMSAVCFRISSQLVTPCCTCGGLIGKLIVLHRDMEVNILTDIHGFIRYIRYKTEGKQIKIFLVQSIFFLCRWWLATRNLVKLNVSNYAKSPFSNVYNNLCVQPVSQQNEEKSILYICCLLH